MHYFWRIQSFLIELIKCLCNLTLKMNHWIPLINVLLYDSFNDFMQISIIFWILVSIQFIFRFYLVSIQFSLKNFHFYSVSIQFSKKFFITIQFLFSFLSQFWLSFYSVYIQFQLTDTTLNDTGPKSAWCSGTESIRGNTE